MELSKSDGLFQNSMHGTQINMEIISKFSHLNPKKQSALDKLRNLQTNSPNMDPLNLPKIHRELQLSNIGEIESSKMAGGAFNSIINNLIPKSEPKKVQKQMELKTIDKTKWELQELILGHTGHITSLCIDPMGKFYVSGSSDSTIKFWDPISNELQLTLTGHIMSVRGMKISSKMPYLFSCSEDKTVKCWDLEKNKVVRDYHGHLSSVYCIELDDSKSQIMTGGRDSSVRIWDIRTRDEIMLLSGHKGSITKIQQCSNGNELISSSLDSTVKRWDLRMQGKCLNTLTYHTKGVRSFIVNDEMLVSGSTNGFKKFKMPSLQYIDDLQYFNGHKQLSGNIIVNTMDINEEGIIFAGCDDGRFAFWDSRDGGMIQEGSQIPIPGSLEGENGIICSLFDSGNNRLFTGSMDKSIRIYKR